MSLMTSLLNGERPTLSGGVPAPIVHRHSADVRTERAAPHTAAKPSIDAHGARQPRKSRTDTPLVATPVTVVTEPVSVPPASQPAITQSLAGTIDADTIAATVEVPTLGETTLGPLAVDLQTLLRTRMLVTSSSGGGKSWALRRLLEQTSSLVQQLIIDPEGEFDTLADHYPYAVFNDHSAAVPISQCSPERLAQELMRSKTSAVLDISDFDTDERHEFVSCFIHGLMALDKEHWHHVLVVLDEAHLFAPQHDKSDAKKALIDLAGRGRKRGYCPVLATQRLSKLNKSVAAELQNRLIGQTVLDTDLRRAADELGMSIAETTAVLPKLDPGEFYVYGPALTRTVQQLKIGPIQTAHGAQLGDVQPPTPVTADTLAAIFTVVERRDPTKPRPAGNDETSDADESTAPDRNLLRQREAGARVEIIKQILEANPGDARGELLNRISAERQISRATLYKWMTKFDPAQPIESLMPQRTPRTPALAAPVAPVPHTPSARTPGSLRDDTKTFLNSAPAATIVGPVPSEPFHFSELQATLPECCEKHGLARPSEADIATAGDKFDEMMPGSQAFATDRAVRKYKALFNAAHKLYGNGLIGLLPKIAARGNRTARLSPEMEALIASILKAAVRYKWDRAEAYSRLVNRCASAHVQPVTRQPFYIRFERNVQEEP